MSDIDSDKSLEAMKSEMDSMDSNQIWTFIDPPKGTRPVGCKWVYKRKLGGDGEVTAFKARLVAKGYTKRPRIDFEETYSLVAMAKSIRILLAIAAWYDYEIWQMDVKTAFLNGFVEEETFIGQPEGFTTVGEEQKVCHLQRTWEASYIFGIKIYRDRSRRMLGLTQSSYIEKVLKRFKMKHSKRGFLPVRHGIKLSKKQSPKTDEELKRMSNIPYASAIEYTTADSTTEAEYIAASEAAKEAVWMKNYIQKLGVVPSIVEPVVIFCDNNGAIAQAKEPRSHHRSKHILKRYHLLREMVSRGNCRMDRVSSAENTADPLTKPMSQVTRTQHLNKMGLRSLQDWL
ncbi:UNVERIFIED_CONTAM: Copia protein [Sesamum radiatum]|uniref:Copia protein n=1 Tax=Sesamum radiatum TaxID=300843 RepID=A0AAW2IKN0_SESRA